MTKLLCLALAALASTGTGPRAPRPWPHWQRYVERFVTKDGRVVERSAHDRTTSEGQAYALFFALVDDDRALFDRLLGWTDANLAEGALGRRLPAWEWGRAKDGRWRVLDRNAASDADLWLGYTLVEAGRLWRAPRYATLGRRLLASVVAREVRTLPGLGPTLLPGPAGFELDGGRAWRLNPSYVPLAIARGLAHEAVPGPWSAIAQSQARLLREASHRGFAPDWVLYRADGTFAPDPEHGLVSSYDAIRVPLWLALDDPGDALARKASASAGGLVGAFEKSGVVPERVEVSGGETSGAAPIGFVAVALLVARVRGDESVATRLAALLDDARVDGLYGTPARYYDQNLVLFSLGRLDGRFRFDAAGRLHTSWGDSCD